MNKATHSSQKVFVVVIPNRKINKEGLTSSISLDLNVQEEKGQEDGRQQDAEGIHISQKNGTRSQQMTFEK
jgi:hypothetical protein